MKKDERKMLICFLAPVVIIYLGFFLYPTIRTTFMSLYKVPNLSSPVSKWEFVGIDNYVSLLKNPLFITSYTNVLKILFIGGIAVFAVALFFAIILSSMTRGKRFCRAIIYLPNIITPIALVTMWTQYIFNSKFGLLKTVFSFLGFEKLAEIPWTSVEMAFVSMLIAFCFGSVGYYMVIYLASMEKIPEDFYDYAALEGAKKSQMFFRITLPLLKDTTRTAVIFWCMGAINFFLWSRVFNINTLDPSTIVPANYMFSLVFGGGVGQISTGSLQVGPGAAIGVILCISATVVFGLSNLIFKSEKYEY
ncbi:MAG: carbohydrate ABC transporter permease [Cellulosilyticaceae bacterium]